MNVERELEEALQGSDRSLQSSAALEILHRTLRSSTPPPSDVLIAFATYLINSANTPLIVGRSALTALVLALGAGLSIDLCLLKPSLYSSEQAKGKITPEESLDSEEQRFYQTGKEVWESKNSEAFEARKTVVEGIVNAVGSPGHESGSDGGRGWCEEQVTSLKHLLSYILELEEDWLASAKVLISIPLETTSRCELLYMIITDDQKLDVYMKIVRLLLECGESGQAQTYFNRASLLIHSSKDKATQLAFKLCQARLADFSRRFNEAAVKYHDLSFEQDIDEEERVFMFSSILRKMFLDQILRVSEVKEFEGQLQEHQLAKIPLDRRLVIVDEEEEGTKVKGRKGPENVLDKAVYDNIKFDGLGALLDLTPYAAEAMARTCAKCQSTFRISMIEQGRLRAWIDQVDRTIYFEGRSQDEEDIQGTAGGLGIERVEKPIQGITLTERWDERIKETSLKHVTPLLPRSQAHVGNPTPKLARLLYRHWGSHGPHWRQDVGSGVPRSYADGEEFTSGNHRLESDTADEDRGRLLAKPASVVQVRPVTMPRAIVQHTPLAIRLTEPITYLRGSATGEDARGRPLQARPDEPPAVIRGLLTLKLMKPSRIRRIEVKLEGKARTEWPEGIGPRRTETSEEHIFISETLTFFTAAQSHSRSRDRRAVSLGPGSRIDEDWGLDEEDEMSEGEEHDGQEDWGRGRTGRDDAREQDERGRMLFGRGQMRSFSALSEGPRPPLDHSQTQPPTRRQSFDRDITSVINSTIDEAPGFVLGGNPRRTSVGDYTNNTPRQPARSEDLFRQRGPSPAYSFRDPLRSSSAFHPRTTSLRQEAETGESHGRPAGGYHYSNDEADVAEMSLSPIASVDVSAESSRWASPQGRQSATESRVAHGMSPPRPTSPPGRPSATQPSPQSSPPLPPPPPPVLGPRDEPATIHRALNTPSGSISALPEGSPSNSEARQSISSRSDINYISVTRPGSRQSSLVEQVPSPQQSPILGPQGHRSRASREGSMSSLMRPPLLHLGSSRRPSGSQLSANMQSASASQTSITHGLGLHEPGASSSSSLTTGNASGERGRKPSKFSFAAVTNTLRNMSKSGTGSRSRSRAPLTAAPSGSGHASTASPIPPVSRAPSVIADGRLRRLADENEEFRPFGRGGAGRSPSRSGRGTSASRGKDERSESRSRGRHIGLKVLTGAFTSDDLDDGEGVHNWKEFRKGTYNYPISFSIPAQCPPTIHADFGSVTYRLKATVVRVGALSPNFVEEQEVILIASPGEDDLEETENVIVERQWEDQLRSDSDEPTIHANVKVQDLPIIGDH
ncbi:hypothetical protein QFC19_001607 [Naganishia cerealis]|uniref:Uncharacterized protein n=1 Tax=Naganishia cerealis TaxID=610337 RepID=A0ACC2WGE1_9TREE|nr:hypothetical protein QFC19_001607 [Naganishia cerealis]